MLEEDKGKMVAFVSMENKEQHIKWFHGVECFKAFISKGYLDMTDKEFHEAKTREFEKRLDEKLKSNE